MTAALSAENKRFRETGAERLRRLALGTAYAVKPGRVSGLPGLWALWLRHRVSHGEDLPSPERALTDPDGLCGICTKFDAERMLEGYRRGLFVFSHIGPIKWWSPSTRPVLFYDEFKIEKRVRKLIRDGVFRYTFDTAFADVVDACRRPRQGKVPLTWMRPEVVAPFLDAFDAGHAHSVEVWDHDGALVGGAFGTAVGGLFIAESQFFRVSNASKAGYVVLNRHLQEWGFTLNDAKFQSPFMAQQGYRDMPRREYLDVISAATGQSLKPGRWRVDPALEVAAWKPAAASPAKDAAA